MEDLIRLLKEGVYNVEDLKFMNMKKQNKFINNPYRTKVLEIFDIEKNITLEDKIQIIDIFEDGIATYMINLINKWREEKEFLPKDKWDTPKTVSKKAWIKRNDLKKIVNMGGYNLFNRNFKSLELKCPSTEYGYSMEYTDEHVANQWFHDLCKIFFNIEKKWFKENDPKQIKITKVKELGEIYGVFNCKLLNDIVWNSKKDINDNELDIFIDAYEELKKCKEIQIQKIEQLLGSDIMYEDE